MRSALIGILLLSLAACSSDKEQPSFGLQMIQIGMAKIGGLGKEQYTPTAAEIKASATPEALAKIGKPVMLAELPGVGLADILIFVQQNGTYSTWASSDGVSFSFDRGLLVATRGMGRDLMSADVEEVLRGITNGAGSGVRVHRYLDGDDQLVMTSFYCYYNRLEGGGSPSAANRAIMNSRINTG